jgi:hypothetical protein
MVVPPTLTHGSRTAELGQRKTEPSQALLLFSFVAGAGIATALAAATASGPFAGMRPVAHSSAAPTHLVRSAVQYKEIDASALFPAPAPPATVQKVVHVYDMPAAAPTTKEKEKDKGKSEHKGGPQPAQSSQPSERPAPKDQHAPPTPKPQPQSTPEPQPTPQPSEPPNGVPGQ